jgi:hypothetical protein
VNVVDVITATITVPGNRPSESCLTRITSSAGTMPSPVQSLVGSIRIVWVFSLTTTIDALACAAARSTSDWIAGWRTDIHAAHRAAAHCAAGRGVSFYVPTMKKKTRNVVIAADY